MALALLDALFEEDAGAVEGLGTTATTADLLDAAVALLEVGAALLGLTAEETKTEEAGVDETGADEKEEESITELSASLLVLLGSLIVETI